MLYKLNTNLVGIFSGTYDTFWDVDEYDDDGNELPTCYDHNEFMKSIAEAYQERADDIRNEINIPWVKSISFPGSFYSPREYNFSTDSLDMNVKVDQRAMIRYAKSLLTSDHYREWLSEHYSSRSGFWSFTPDTPAGILEAINKKTSELDQAVGALITYAMQQNSEHSGEYGEGPEGMALETWSGNGYMDLDWWVECGECFGKMQWDMDSEWHCVNPECKTNLINTKEA